MQTRSSKDELKRRGMKAGMMKNGRHSLPRAIAAIGLIGSLSVAMAFDARSQPAPDEDAVRDVDRSPRALRATEGPLRIETSSGSSAILSVDSLHGLTEGDVVYFEPPGTASRDAIKLRLERKDRIATGRFAWSFSGRDLTEFAVFVVRNDTIAGAVHVRGPHWWRLITSVDDVVSVEMLDDEELPGCGGALPAPNPVPLDGGLAGGGVCSGACSETTVGLGIFYTPNAIIGAGGVFQVEALCELSVALANEGFINSDSFTRVRINHLGPINYDDAVEEGHLGHLSDPDDGYMDEVQPIMAVTGSDIGVLIAEYGEGYCGVAYLGPARYHVNVRGCMGGFVLAHELGHNLGACHACGDGGGCGCGGYLEYSVGWRWYGESGQQWRTILAYGPGERIPHYSNPRISHDGVPTGVPVGETDQADNVLTFEETTPIVSAFACPPSTVQTVKILPSNPEELDVFGQSTAISDGRVIVGAYLSDGLATNSGGTYVFGPASKADGECPDDPYGYPSETCWIERAQPPNLGARTNDALGRSLDAEDDWLAAGAPFADIFSLDKEGNEVVEVERCGGVFLYSRIGESWCQAEILYSDNPAEDDQFGFAVAMDGDTLVAGAPRTDVDGDSFAGAAEVFTRIGTSWSHVVTIPGGSLGETARFGSAVAIDGEHLAIGAPYARGDRGAIRTYRNVGGTWTFVTELVVSDEGDARFGSSVSISGEWMLVGAPNADTEDGRAYMYRFNGTTWELAQEIAPLGGENDGKFGTSVSIDEEYAIIGAPTSPGLGVEYTGAAFMLKRVTTTWYLIAIITAFDAEEGDQYGLSVAVEDGLLVVGAGYDNDNGIQSGSAYVHPFEPLVDCNQNGYADDLEILQGISFDNDGNGVPDECDCLADMNFDQVVDGFDLNIFLDAWGSSGANLRPDIDLDGYVDGTDLNILLGFWGVCPGS